MGGYGSGRTGGKMLTSQMLALDVRTLYSIGLVENLRRLQSKRQLESRDESGKVHIRVNAQHMSLNYFYIGYSGECLLINILIKFDWTSCYFGGRRLWFLCPKCRRRVAILYGGKNFYCRICRNLAYPSENEKKPNRLLRKANKIKKCLECGPEFRIK